MEETGFANLDELNMRKQSSQNAFTILEAQKMDADQSSRPEVNAKYLKKSTVFIIIAFTVNVAALVCIGSGVLVYLVTTGNRECKLILPESYSISESHDNVSTTAKKVGAVSVESTTIGRQGCPSNWLTYGQSCYFFSNQSATWLDAMVRCRKLGGYLAEIDTAAENQFLKTHGKTINNIECFPTTSIEYRGVRNTTFDGRVCQRWDSQKPHSHTRNNIINFPETTLADVANYCRDPDKEGLPWCYTTDPDKRWQFCDIYKCPGGNWWVGMVVLEGKWKWMNKQTELIKEYTNWGPTEPSKGNCGSVKGALDFAWDAVNCKFPAMYLCEK